MSAFIPKLFILLNNKPPGCLHSCLIPFILLFKLLSPISFNNINQMMKHNNLLCNLLLSLSLSANMYYVKSKTFSASYKHNFSSHIKSLTIRVTFLLNDPTRNFFFYYFLFSPSSHRQNWWEKYYIINYLVASHRGTCEEINWRQQYTNSPRDKKNVLRVVANLIINFIRH